MAPDQAARLTSKILMEKNEGGQSDRRAWNRPWSKRRHRSDQHAPFFSFASQLGLAG